MAVEITSDFSGPYTPDGVTTVFPFDFSALSADEVSVVRIAPDWSDAVITGYTVTLNDAGGGVVTFTSAPLAGYPLYIVSNPSFEQQYDFNNQGNFSPKSVTKAFDRAAIRDIALASAIGRSALAPPTETLGVLPPAADRAGKFMAFDADGQATVAAGTTSGGTDPSLRSDLSASTGTALISYVPATGVAAVNLFTALRLSLSIVPAHFGAVGNGTTNDTTALQAFWDYVFANDVPHDCSGNYAISATVNIGPASPPSTLPSRPIVGWQRLVALNAMNEMVRRRNLAFRSWVGGLETVGMGSTTYASRTCLIGVHEENNARLIVTGGTIASYFSLAGVWFGTPNNNAMNTGRIRATHCGSGHAAGSLTGTWSSPVNTGSLGSGSQRTTVNLSAFPSAALLAYFVFGSEAVYVRLNGVPGAKFYVYSVDTAAGTAQLYRQIDQTVYGTSGTFEWCFGGGYTTRGSDSNIVDVPFLDCSNCGNGRNDGTLYPSRVRAAQFNGCGTDEHFGKSPSGAISGAFSQAAYTESTNSYEQVTWAGRFGATSFGTIMSGSGGTDLSRWFMLGDPLGASGIAGGEAGALGVGGLAIINKGRFLWQTKPNITHGPGSTYNLSGQSRPLTPEVFNLNSLNLQLQVVGSGENNRLFGYTGGIVGFTGTGTNGAPTGSFSFLPPTKDYTGTLTNASAIVPMASTAGLATGMPIAGTGVPGSTTILTVDSPTQITMSAAATASGANTLTVTGSVNGSFANVSFSGFTGRTFFAYDHTDLYQLVWTVGTISGKGRDGLAGIATKGNADVTLTPGADKVSERFTTTLTADRAVTLSTAGAVEGNRFRIARPATGAFNLNVGTGPLKALAAGQWCEVEYDGAAWQLMSFGSL